MNVSQKRSVIFTSPKRCCTIYLFVRSLLETRSPSQHARILDLHNKRNVFRPAKRLSLLLLRPSFQSFIRKSNSLARSASLGVPPAHHSSRRGHPVLVTRDSRTPSSLSYARFDRETSAVPDSCKSLVLVLLPLLLPEHHVTNYTPQRPPPSRPNGR